MSYSTCHTIGFFPNQKKQTSGIIFPFYGESSNQGFFLRNGGYYFAINDYIDLSLIGDIYSKGSWNLKAIPIIKKISLSMEMLI